MASASVSPRRSPAAGLRSARAGAGPLLLLLLLSPRAAAETPHRPSEPVAGDVWRFGGGFEYPELSAGAYGMPQLLARPNLGIAVRTAARARRRARAWGRARVPGAARACPGPRAPAQGPRAPARRPYARPPPRAQLSGGGYRATTLALGWVRALHAMGAMGAARYLASNSGGSWFNGAYSYTQASAACPRAGARFARGPRWPLRAPRAAAAAASRQCPLPPPPPPAPRTPARAGAQPPVPGALPPPRAPHALRGRAARRARLIRARH